MSASLEERVRLLTDQATAARTQSELDAILTELKGAIRDYVRYLRAIAVETVPEVFGTQSKNNRFPKMFENQVNLAPTVPTAPKHQSRGLVAAIALPMAFVLTAAIMFTLLVLSSGSIKACSFIRWMTPISSLR